MAETERKIDVDKPQHKYLCLMMDTRGRVTIPKGTRAQYGIDPEDDKKYWLNIEITSIEVRSDNGGDT